MNLLQYCLDVDRAVEKNDQAYAQYLDPIAEGFININYSVISVADAKAELVGAKAFNNPSKIFRNVMLYRLAILFEKCFKLDILSYLCRKYLIKNHVAAVYGIGLPRWLCKAARHHKIPVVEIAHGMGLVGIQWNWDKIDKKELPTHFYVYDTVTLETYKSFFDKNCIDVSQIANPYLANSNILTNTYKSTLAKSNIAYQKSKVKVLILLQWGYSGELKTFSKLIPNGFLPYSIIKFIENSTDEYFWIFKLHPVQVRNPKRYKCHYQILKEIESTSTNIEWKMASKSPISDVILASDLCVTLSSTSAYDAATFGRKTLLLCPTLKDGNENSNWFPDLKRLGFVKVYHKESDLTQFLRNEPAQLMDYENMKASASANDLIIKLIKRGSSEKEMK